MFLANPCQKPMPEIQFPYLLRIRLISAVAICLFHRMNFPVISQDINLMICWFNEKPLKIGGRYLIRINSNEVGCVIKTVNYRMNINTLEQGF